MEPSLQHAEDLTVDPVDEDAYFLVAFCSVKVRDDGLILSTQMCFLKGADVQLPSSTSQDLLKQDAEAKKMEAEAVKLTQQVEQSQEKVQVLQEEVQDGDNSTKNTWVRREEAHTLQGLRVCHSCTLHTLFVMG